jgi:hypothetical protein
VAGVGRITTLGLEMSLMSDILQEAAFCLGAAIWCRGHSAYDIRQGLFPHMAEFRVTHSWPRHWLLDGFQPHRFQLDMVATVTSAALDLIIGVWLIVYAVPAIFDEKVAGLVDLGIVVLGLAHIAARLR